MINIIKKEIDVEESLKKRLEIICDFCNTTPTIINGSIRKVDKTNLSYIELHKIIINNNVFLAFNYSVNVNIFCSFMTKTYVGLCQKYFMVNMRIINYPHIHFCFLIIDSLNIIHLLHIPLYLNLVHCYRQGI